jgi:hypothetical protein
MDEASSAAEILMHAMDDNHNDLLTLDEVSLLLASGY